MAPKHLAPARKGTVLLSVLCCILFLVLVTSMLVAESTDDGEESGDDAEDSDSAWGPLPPGLLVILALGLLVLAFLFYCRAYPKKKKH